MRGPSAPLRGALLGLVLERGGHSYDLATRLIARLGATWRIDHKDVYRLLEQLEERDLLASKEEPMPSRRGTYVVYSPTELTERAVVEWMETFVPMAPVRVGLQAKLAVARAADAPRLIAALRQYERECLELLKEAAPRSALASSWRTLFLDCTRESIEGQLRQEIAWAKHTRTRIREYAEAVA